MALADFKLEDRFDRMEGDVAMSGVQALLRVLLDQLRADRRDGLNNAAMVSGYRGSPLGGIDSLMLGNAEELQQNNIMFEPGLNEDLGATIVWGSQLANRNFQGRYDGVLGMWYGKAPGVDRSGDAIKHANVCGGRPQGRRAARSRRRPGIEVLHARVRVRTGADPLPDADPVPRLGAGGHRLRALGLRTVPLQRILVGAQDRHQRGRRVRDGAGRPRPCVGRPTRVRVGGQALGAHPAETPCSAPTRCAWSSRSTRAAWLRWTSSSRPTSSTARRFPTRDARIGLVAAGKTYYDLREALDPHGARRHRARTPGRAHLEARGGVAARAHRRA